MGATLLEALAYVIHIAIHIYIFIIIARSLISWAGTIPANPLIHFLRKLTDPLFRLVHRHVPFMVVGNIDISPIVIVLALYLADRLIVGFLMGLALDMSGPSGSSIPQPGKHTQGL